LWKFQAGELKETPLDCGGTSELLLGGSGVPDARKPIHNWHRVVHHFDELQDMWVALGDLIHDPGTVPDQTLGQRLAAKLPPQAHSVDGTERGPLEREGVLAETHCGVPARPDRPVNDPLVQADMVAGVRANPDAVVHWDHP